MPTESTLTFVVRVLPSTHPAAPLRGLVRPARRNFLYKWTKITPLNAMCTMHTRCKEGRGRHHSIQGWGSTQWTVRSSSSCAGCRSSLPNAARSMRAALQAAVSSQTEMMPSPRKSSCGERRSCHCRPWSAADSATKCSTASARSRSKRRSQSRSLPSLSHPPRAPLYTADPDTKGYRCRLQTDGGPDRQDTERENTAELS